MFNLIFLSEYRRLLLGVATNGVIQPIRLSTALWCCNDERPINFTKKDTKHFCDEYGSVLRMGLSKFRELLGPRALDRCYAKAAGFQRFCLPPICNDSVVFIFVELYIYIYIYIYIFNFK